MRSDVLKAINRGDVIGLRNALDSGLDPDYPSPALRSGATMLSFAALARGNTAIGRELISHGASLDARDNQGWTALCAAVHSGHIGFVELLLKSGASLDNQGCAGGTIESMLEWSLKYGTGAKETIKK